MSLPDALKRASRWTETNKRDSVILMYEFTVAGKRVRAFHWYAVDDAPRLGTIVTYVRWDAATGCVTVERVG